MSLVAAFDGDDLSAFAQESEAPRIGASQFGCTQNPPRHSTDGRHGTAVGVGTVTSSPDRAPAIRQKDDVGSGDGAHEETSSFRMEKSYGMEQGMSSPLRAKNLSQTRLTEMVIQDRLGGIIRRRPVKTTSATTGLSEAAIKKWRQFGLPEAVIRAIQLVLGDDEIWAEACRLRQRSIDALDQKIAETQAEIERLQNLRRGLLHASSDCVGDVGNL